MASSFSLVIQTGAFHPDDRADFADYALFGDGDCRIAYGAQAVGPDCNRGL